MASLIKNTNFNMRINKEKKHQLESLFSSLGMTLPEAVNIFFEKALRVGGIPFDVIQPRYNQDTEDAMKEAIKVAQDKNAKTYNSLSEILKEENLI